MSTTTTVVISANATQKISIPNWAAISTMIVSNSTQFDLIWAGFGVQGQIDIPAGHQWKFEASVYNSGTLTVTAQDNLNVGGSGPVSITSFLIGEPIPEGSWPVTVPAQRVITPVSGSVVATNLVNQGNPGSGTPVIDVAQSGSTGDQLFADNQGNFYIQDYVSSVLTTIFRTIAGGGAGTVDLLLGDNNRQIQVNGQSHFKGRAWFDSEFSYQDGNGPGGGGGSSAAAIGQLFNNNTRGLEITPNSGVTGFVGVQVDSSGVNNTGTGFIANAVQLGAYLTSCYGGMKIDGLAPNGGIDMSAMNASSGASILPGPQPLILSGGGGIFSTVGGSVSGTANLFTPIWTTGLKIGWVTLLNNFNTASNVTLLFPSQITTAWYYSGDISGTTWQAFLGGSAAAMRHTLTFGGAGAGGTSESVSNIKNLNIGQFLGSDRIIINTTAGGNINSFFFFVGV